MRNLAIIAEYNPFHNGHSYHLNTALKLTGADYSIAVMSGNFLQRGIPAVIDKYRRAKMAAASGIDLVLELPFAYATASARDFATAAVTLLNKLHQIDYLAFGAEEQDLELLQEIADIMIREPDSYVTTLKSGLSSGLSYPKARALALCTYFNDNSVTAVIEQPNNILALEYLAALKQTHSTIQPVLIQRNSSDYNSTDITVDFCSSTAIREYLRSDKFIKNSTELEVIRQQVPPQVYPLLCETFEQYAPVFEDDFSDSLQYKLILDRNAKLSYSEICDMSQDLFHRLKNTDFNLTFREIADELKTKNIAHTRINRALLHYLTNLKASDMEKFKQGGYIYYAKILSFRNESTPLIKSLTKAAEIPLITKTSAIRSAVSDTGIHLFSYDLLATDLYANTVYKKNGYRLPNEYQTSPHMIK